MPQNTPPQFNPSNPDHILYLNPILAIEVLGGIRLEGLDRMRVTLKIALQESEVPPIRHNLDLYNDNQLEKIIRKTAERLEIGTSTISASLSQLTQELESYRLQKIKEQNNEAQTQSKPLTEQQRAAAVAYLQQENLLALTIEHLQQSGIIGEEENALILWLAMSSRKMSEPLSVVCLAQSGTGKSYLMDKVAQCIPPEELREHTQFTGNAFYYYKREEIKHKTFIIKDLEGALNALFPIRELQSEQRISKTITRKGKDGKLETITLVVEGPVSVIAVTTQETIYEDNANRSILIYLDNSQAQDQRIMNYQKNKRAGLIDTRAEKERQQQLQHIQKTLQPIKVINPYAPFIDLPDNFPKKRRALPILLNFIETITFYHQYQRTQKADKDTAEVYIESSPEDVANGFKYLKTVLFRRSDELNGALRDFYETLKTLVAKHPSTNGEGQGLRSSFTIADIRKELSKAPRTLQHYIKQLLEYQYLEIIGGKQRTGYQYQIQEQNSQQYIQQNIETHIHNIMQDIYKAAHKKLKTKSPTLEEKEAQKRG